MQVVILAGGLGTRLYPLTRTVPKPMVPVGGRPFLERQVAYLAAQGFRQFLLLTGYLGEQIEEHFGDGSALGVSIGYSREARPLGTGGGLRQAVDHLEERFLLLYGDSFLPEDYPAIAARFRGGGDGGLMAVYEDAGGATAVAANVAVGPGERVSRYHKGGREEDLRFIEAGAVALAARVVAELPGGRPLALETELYPALARTGELGAWITRQRFFDIGTPGGLERAEEYFRAGESPPPGEARGT